jgi:lycopene cyclase domain-containing protein
MSLYAWLLFLSFIGPFALSFDRKVAFYKSWGRLFTGIALNAIIFILWDGWFARTKVWGFNPNYVWNIRWNDLPIEEWLFFIVIPYCSVFIYACLKVYIQTEPFAKNKHHITLFFLIATFFLALFNSTQAYTFYNCLIAAILLSIHYLFLRKDWMGYFWLAYFVHLIPFLIINGVLTGIATDKPVVWYNDNENIGVRIFTIPVEDTIYALTCLLLPITVMEMLVGKKIKRKGTLAVKHK